jgi:hypothetical protein
MPSRARRQFLYSAHESGGRGALVALQKSSEMSACICSSSSIDLQHGDKIFHQVTNARRGTSCRNRLLLHFILQRSMCVHVLLRLAQLSQGSLALNAHDVAQRSDDACTHAQVERVNGDAV